MLKVLHLTHTDIRTDSRILKEIHSIASHIDSRIKGIGIEKIAEGDRKDSAERVELEVLSLFSKRAPRLPKPVRHALTVFEFSARALVQAVRFRPDLVHCHDTTALPLGALVKMFTGAKLVYDAHELESNRNGLSPALGRLTLRCEKILWRLVDGLVVVSPSIDRWYADNVGPKTSEVVMNSPVIDTTSPARGDDYLREAFAIAADSKIFIYVGIIGEGRGIELILDAFQQPDVQSSIVFMGSGGLAASVKSAAAKHDNVYYHEPVPHGDVVAVTRSADYGLCLIQNVSLSDYHCLPNKLFEYVFAGVPVLASDFPDISKLVNEFDLGICCDLTLEDVRRGIQAIEQRTFDIRFEDLQGLSWQAQTRKLVDLYEELLATSHTIERLPGASVE